MAGTVPPGLKLNRGNSDVAPQGKADRDKLLLLGNHSSSIRSEGRVETGF